MNSDALPTAETIKASFNTNFSQEVLQRMATQDIRELIIEDLKPTTPVEYEFSKNLEEEKRVDILELVEKQGFGLHLLGNGKIKIFLR